MKPGVFVVVIFCVGLSIVCTLSIPGAPGAPYDMRVGNITNTSVDLDWFSGDDMGSKQHFYIVRWINRTTTIKFSDDIYGPYKDGGLGQPWNYHLTGLTHATHYILAVVAENANNKTYSVGVQFNTPFTRDAVINISGGVHHL